MSHVGTAVFVLTQWFFPDDALNVCSWLQCYDSVGLSHFSGLCDVRHTSFKINLYVGVQVLRSPNFFSRGMEADRNVKVVGGDVTVL